MEEQEEEDNDEKYINSFPISNTNNQDNLFKRITLLEEKLEKSLQEVKTLKKEINTTKTQIFSVMALFFGVFAFISIDLNFSKDLFNFQYPNYFYFYQFSIPSSLYIPIIFIATQFIFFYCIWKYLISSFIKHNKKLK